ncbi:MAG TPA: hypothetical protein VFB63_05090 [Bryobacteraceae bacterium]|nr:hypothetical protein [Bryobacteraceae bacterium]
MDTLQREHWDGRAVSLREAWRLRKVACGSAKEAICELFSHQLGHELRLTANGELLASQVCRNSEQVLTTQEQWKKAMVEKGWR